MDAQVVNQYLVENQKYLPKEKFFFIREQLLKLDEEQFNVLYGIDYKDPVLILLISVFFGYFGVDRFLINDIALGIVKLLTCGGCGVWTVIDWILITDKTKKYNFDHLMETIRLSYLS